MTRIIQGFRAQGTAYLFLLPCLVILGALLSVPLYKVVEYSLYDNVIVERNPTFVGLQNYRDLLTDGAYWSASLNTILFTIGSVVGHIIVGTGLALLVNSDINRHAQTLFRSLLILPWIFTAVVVALNWQLLLNPFGVVNYALGQLGLIDEPLDWLGDPALAMWSLLVISTWRGYPFIMVSFLSGLQSIPQELYEAAEIDGAGFFAKFWHVTIPQLKPVIYGVALLDLIWTFQLFPLVWLTTGGGPGRATEVLSTMTFRFAFVDFEFSKAATAAVSILVISAAFTILYLRNETRKI
ncbi:carbohydrate ABC transporter membrane protein 1 (CUT1 family) [Primorskyibacter sedentarius]|uniref:Carbohydrate ABC transporter membrane protein 1 (CUT1 family) n=1 Tax=Primorskyibacter sedentarius TaxID=745311 RepID=A0A4R3J7X2_9RHOB|nr:sugar ABC transporter permease [Primorskyibacter sedentarius]TCS61542.1 carbohydrate ABC transporter membrane protein 1 (CUT1 family) [Primorskyibacter sedentarius]